MMTARAALVGGTRSSAFTPTSLGLASLFMPGNFTKTGTDTWTATTGSDVTPETGSDSASVTATGGCPTFDYAGSSSANLGLTNAVTMTTWGGGAASDRWYWGVVDLTAVTPTDTTNVYLDAMLIDGAPDAGVYTGLGFYKNGAVYTAFFYQYDGAVKVTTVDVSSLLPAGAGRVTLQGWKTGGSIYVRANNLTESAGTVAGNVSATTDVQRIGRRIDGTIRAIGTRASAPTLTERNNVATWGATA